MSDRLRKLLGGKTDREIRTELERDPTIREARRHLRDADSSLNKADQVLREFENLEPRR